jgi:eukaryotic-like serine/threonine-protein kinase
VSKALQPDDLIAHYRVVRALGAGGMGEVYLARDSTLDRDIALKVLPQMAQDDDRVRRFVLEAKSASSLSHPHIITVYEIGCEPVISANGARPEKVNYIAMELVDGDALADIIHGNKADLKSVLGYLAQAADGLAKAHASGIVHRDLKPGNIMVSKDGYAKVLDFGLAKLVEKETAPDATINIATKPALTMDGMIVGTIGYMAPEQILGRPVDHRSDIFSFGCILYEAITRQRPFTAGSQFEALQKIIHEHPAPIEASVPDAPMELRQLVARCLAKAPEARIPSMKDVASELRRIAGSYDVLSRSAGAATDATVFFPTPSAIAAPSGAAAPPGAYPPGYPPYPSSAFPAPSTVVLPEKKKLPVAAIAGIALVVLAIAGFAVWKFAPGKSGGLSDEALTRMKIAPVLSNELLQNIAVSPDGRYAAYVSLASTKYQLQVRQISTGKDIDIVKPQGEPITDLTFSPDGDHLWYVVREAENALYSSLFEVASLGGDARKAVSDADTAPAFSPDGKAIAFIRGAPAAKKTMLVVHPLEGGATDRTVATVNSELDVVIDKPRWSPDGKKIAVISTEVPGHPQVVVYDAAADNGKGQAVGNWEGPVIDSVAWMGDEGLVIAGAPTPGPVLQLWYVAYPGGQRRRLSNDLSTYRFVSTSADGKTITALRLQRAAEIWQVPTDGAGEMKQLTQGKEPVSSITGAADGTLIFVAPQEDTMTLWALKSGGGRVAIAPKGMSVLTHKFIRGQEATAFTAYGPDFVGHIFRVGIDGGNAKQLTSETGEQVIAVTPDGKFLLYNTPQAPRTVFVMASDGTGKRQLAADYIDGLVFSHDSSRMSYNRLDASQNQVVPVRVVMNFADGKVLATLPPARGTLDYQFTPDGNALTYIQAPPQPKPPAPPGVPSVMKIALNDGAPEKLFEMPESRVDVARWVDDKTLIVAARSTTRPVNNLWRWTVGSPKPIAITNFPTGVIYEVSPSQDGRIMYFTQGSLNRDIIKITGLK